MRRNVDSRVGVQHDSAARQPDHDAARRVREARLIGHAHHRARHSGLSTSDLYLGSFPSPLPPCSTPFPSFPPSIYSRYKVTPSQTPASTHPLTPTPTHPTGNLQHKLLQLRARRRRRAVVRLELLLDLLGLRRAADLADHGRVGVQRARQVQGAAGVVCSGGGSGAREEGRDRAWGSSEGTSGNRGVSSLFSLEVKVSVEGDAGMGRRRFCIARVRVGRLVGRTHMVQTEGSFSLFATFLPLSKLVELSVYHKARMKSKLHPCFDKHPPQTTPPHQNVQSPTERKKRI